MNSFQNTKSIMIYRTKFDELIREFIYLESVLKETKQDGLCKKLRDRLEKIEGEKI